MFDTMEFERDIISVCCYFADEASYDKVILVQKELDKLADENKCVRICFVYGDTTVNATEFREYKQGYYTNIQRPEHSYSKLEGLGLSWGMLRKEKEKIDSERVLIILDKAGVDSYDKSLLTEIQKMAKIEKA